jgi:hypothetical protein
MRNQMSEQERLMLVQNVIDHLLYVEGKERKRFLSKLGKLLVTYPVRKKITYFNYPNLNKNSKLCQ